MDDLHQELLILLKERSVLQGPIELASGAVSDFYVDTKRTTLSARGMYLSGVVFYQHVIEPHAPKAVAGVTLGGDPLVCAVALHAHQLGQTLDAVLVRKEIKGHGTASYLEGARHLSEGAELVLLEDVITTGGSALRALERIEEAGFFCKRMVALVDREEGGREHIESNGVDVRAIFSRRDFQ